MSRRKSHVSPSECKTTNPSTPAQFSLVNWAPRKTSNIWDETYIDIFGGGDERGASWFGDRWWSLTLTLNLAHGACRTINTTK